jgi:hypothetical protein
LSTPWGTSPYAPSTPVIDSIMRTPTPAPTPVPIPGLIPLPFQQLMAPPIPSPYLGVPPLGYPQVPAPFLGVPPLGIPPAPAPFLGVPPVPAPFLGVPPLGIHPAAAALGFDMQTAPWHVAGLGGHVISPVTAMLVSQLGLREAVSKIGDEALKRRVNDNVNDAIDRTIEGVAGMTLHPWFGPGAQSMIYPIAAQLALIADRYPEGALRDALLNIAGQIVQKSIAPAGESAGRHR